ncbi:hypothetical protein, partial [Desulfocastanea catecholica]
DLLQVFLHDADIGTLTMLPSGKTFFSFNENLIQADRALGRRSAGCRVRSANGRHQWIVTGAG